MDKSYIHELLKPTHGPGCTCSWHAPEPEPSPTQDCAGDGDGQEGEAAESNGKKQKPSTTQNTKKQDSQTPSSSQDAEQTTQPSAETSSAQDPTQKSSQTSSQSGNQSDDSAESGKEKTPEAPDSGTSESERASQDDQQDTSQDQDSEPQESECTSDPSMDSEDKQQASSSTSSTMDENSSGSTETTPSTSGEQASSRDGGDSSEEPTEQEDQQQTQQSSESDQSSTNSEQDSTSTENDDPKAQPQSGGMCQDGGSSSPGAGTTTPPQAGAGGPADTSGSQETGETSADQAPEQSNSTQQNTTNETQISDDQDSDSAYTPPSAMTAPITMSSQDQEALAEMLSEKSDDADYEAEIAALARQYPEFQEQGTKFDMDDLRDLEDRDIDMGKIENETWRSTNYKQNLAWGGDHRQPDMVRKAFAQPVTKDLARALHKMIDNEVGSGIYESQRIDGGKLIAQMQSKQLNLTRCRREEMHREKLLILCDISVSCDAVCNQMTAAAYRIIDLDPRLNIIFHSNNSLLEITGQDVDTYVVDQLTKINVMTGIRGDGKEASKQETAEAWRDLLSYLSTKTVLVFGDCDAVHTYEQIIASGVRFFYLGNGSVSGEAFYSSGGYNYGYGQTFENRYPEAQIIATMGGAYNPQKALDEVVAYLSKGTGRIDNGVRIG